MKRYLFLALFLIPILALQASSINKKESIVRIEIQSHDVVYQLQDRFHLSIIDAQNYYVDAYVDAQMIKTLTNAGYKVIILVDDYQKEPAELLPLINTYTQVCSTMYAININYPSITKLETLGYSAGNRLILGMKVTDNPLIEEPEPEIRLVGTHHGDEKISTEITLSFLKYLVENYANSQQVATLVDNREIWVIPILNPDGHVANIRSNGAGVDINRDYGYMWSGEGSSTAPWSQPEPRAIQKHSQNNNISIEYEYHSTASYVNYVWDHMPIDPPDSNYVIQISQEYADSTYGSPTTRLYKINGYDWYYVRGSAQEAAFGIWGNIGTTIETQNPTTQAKVDSICIANRRALMSMITRTGWGISGMVRDSITSQPLFAMIKFTNPKRWIVYTDKQVGDFHKMVSAGTYTFRVEAQGYQPKTFTVDVPINGVTNVDVDLVPDSTSLYYIQKLIWVRRDRPDMVYRTVTMDGLGIPDSISYSLGPAGQIVLEADPPIKNITGVDFTVYEGDATPEFYTVSLSNDWRGSFYSYGSCSGTTNFDLSTVSMDSARYIKIVNSGGGSTSDPYSGFDLDGISYRQMQSSIVDENRQMLSANFLSLTIWPNPAKNYFAVHLPLTTNRSQIKIFDVSGKLIKVEESKGLKEQKISLDGVKNGVYFINITNNKSVITKRLIVIK
jgi:hypothetical protein